MFKLNMMLNIQQRVYIADTLTVGLPGVNNLTHWQGTNRIRSHFNPEMFYQRDSNNLELLREWSSCDNWA